MILKNPPNFSIEGRYLNTVKATPDKPVVLKKQKMKLFLLRSGTRQGYPLLPLLFNVTLGVLVTSIIQEKK
jgi:hypothetical protein